MVRVFSSMQAKSTFSLSLRKVRMAEVCRQVEMVCGILATERGSTFQVLCSEELKEMPVCLSLFLSLARFLTFYILTSMLPPSPLLYGF
jgi:hypothetical protein